MKSLFVLLMLFTGICRAEETQYSSWAITAPATAGFINAVTFGTVAVNGVESGLKTVSAPLGIAKGVWPYVVDHAQGAFNLGRFVGYLTIFSIFVLCFTFSARKLRSNRINSTDD